MTTKLSEDLKHQQVDQEGLPMMDLEDLKIIEEVGPTHTTTEEVSTGTVEELTEEEGGGAIQQLCRTQLYL